MEIWCWWWWRGVSTNNASLSVGRTSAGIVSCFFFVGCVTLSANFVYVCIYSHDYLFFQLMFGQIYRICFILEKLKLTHFLGKNESVKGLERNYTILVGISYIYLANI